MLVSRIPSNKTKINKNIKKLYQIKKNKAKMGKFSKHSFVKIFFHAIYVREQKNSTDEQIQKKKKKRLLNWQTHLLKNKFKMPY